MIYEILHSGEDASVSMLELSQRLCVPERQIRKQIYRERRAGYHGAIICRLRIRRQHGTRSSHFAKSKENMLSHIMRLRTC